MDAILREYLQLKTILERASRNESLDEYLREMVLHVDLHTQQITYANQPALDYLGYSLAEIQGLPIGQIQKLSDTAEIVVYTETAQTIHTYPCIFRHQDGSALATRVRRREMVNGGDSLVHYVLEDLSLRGRLVQELMRREDENFRFREKLKTLNEISNRLGQCTSFDDLCRLSVQLGKEHLLFDRLSLWFLDSEKQRMWGSYGIDESGNLRDERGQHWNFQDTYVEEYLRGRRDPTVTEDRAPLYNDKSEMVAAGWHISVPLLSGNEVIGVMGADNLIRQQRLRSYQPELLRLYGVTIGHLAVSQRERATVLKLSRAIENSASMILILTPQLHIEFANASFYRLSGYDPADVLGQSIQKLIPTRTIDLEQVANLQEWKGELLQTRKNGATYETYLSVSPLWVDGQLMHYVVVQDDISDLKKARQRELDFQIERERVRVLQNFITDMGHEFKTPLAIITTQAYLIQSAPNAVKATERIQKIDTQADVLNKMLDDMLYATKLESGVNLNYTAVDLKGLVGDAVQKLTSLAHAKHQTVQIEVSAPLLFIADVGHLRWAIEELLHNAIRYTPERGTINVRVHQDTHQTVITVQDTGIGIAPEHLEKIFTRFYRVESARTTRGTGLGLTIVRLVAEVHHGEIKAQSQVGQGTQMSLYIPNQPPPSPPTDPDFG